MPATMRHRYAAAALCLLAHAAACLAAAVLPVADTERAAYALCGPDGSSAHTVFIASPGALLEVGGGDSGCAVVACKAGTLPWYTTSLEGGALRSRAPVFRAADGPVSNRSFALADLSSSLNGSAYVTALAPPAGSSSSAVQLRHTLPYFQGRSSQHRTNATPSDAVLNATFSAVFVYDLPAGAGFKATWGCEAAEASLGGGDPPQTPEGVPQSDKALVTPGIVAMCVAASLVLVVVVVKLALVGYNLLSPPPHSPVVSISSISLGNPGADPASSPLAGLMVVST